jgi:DNA-binding MarR family transcriptional regulator
MMSTRSEDDAPGIQGTTSYLIAQVAKAHRKRASDLLGELGLHVGQEMLLEALWTGGALSQTELADRVGVSKATVTVALRSLERAGLVERRRDPEDDRIVRVRATAAAIVLRPRVYGAWRRLEEETVAGLTATERRALDHALGVVRDSLEEGAS